MAPSNLSSGSPFSTGHTSVWPSGGAEGNQLSAMAGRGEKYAIHTEDLGCMIAVAQLGSLGSTLTALTVSGSVAVLTDSTFLL